MAQRQQALTEAAQRQRELAVRRRRIVSVIVLAEALVLLALGAAAFLVSGDDPAEAHTDDTVLLFRVNMTYATLLVVTGALAALAVLSARTTKLFLALQAAFFTALFVYGSARSGGSTDRTLLNLNAADNFLHLALAMIGVVLSLWLAGRYLTNDAEVLGKAEADRR